jgi:hypothetical protein
MKIIFLFLLISAAFAQSEDLEKKCLSGDGLSCAKAAYHLKKSDTRKAFEFYKKGCDLKEESACFNMRAYDPNDAYFKKVDQSLAPYTSKIRLCYIPQVKGKKYSNIQYKENFYKADFSFRIDQQGKANNVDVKTVLDKKFVECAKNIITGLNYPRPEGLNPTYNFNMLFSAYE